MTNEKKVGRPTVGKEAMTGKDKSDRYRDKLRKEGGLSGAFTLTDKDAVKEFKKIQKKMGMTKKGTAELQAERVVLCTGVRESSRSQRFIGGDRPLGIVSTGALQSLVYLQDMSPFQRPVILGSELVSFSAIDTCRHLGISPVAMIEENDQVLDLFCGLGNFSLAMATRAAQVVGIEGDAGLIDRAKQNASLNNIVNVDFYAQDLTQDLSEVSWAQHRYNKILIDPARPGAMEMMQVVAEMKPERIVYVSCNPATLARDAGELVNRFDYVLESVGVMDMFPHTAHVESMALFVKKQ